MAGLSLSMRNVLANIGSRSVTAPEIDVNGVVLKRLWEMGFLKLDLPAEKRLPPHYSLSEKGEGAAAILAGPLAPNDREGPVARIKRAVATHFGIPLDEMTSERRAREVARPRQVAMYLSKQLTPKSLPDIGRQFGGRDHTTVIHAVRKITELMDEDHNFKDEVTALESDLRSEDHAYPQNIVERGHKPTFLEFPASA